MKYININFKILHPFLVAVFPILFLFSQNVFQIDISQIIFPLFLNLLITLILLLILNYFIKDKLKSALIVTTFILWFFSYGHLLNLAIYLDYSISENYNLLVFPIFVIVLSLILFFIFKIKDNLKKFSFLLNVIFALLVSFQLLSIGYSIFLNSEDKVVQLTPDSTVNMPSILPDIYYIILDGYGRRDVQKEIYGLDNTDFLNELENRDFYVTDSSYSNYGTTVSSITSALNFDYIHSLAKFDTSNYNLAPLSEMLFNSRVFQFLSKFGYKTVNFESGYRFTQFEKADYYFSPKTSLSEFENFLINLTPIPFFMQEGKNQFDLHRDRIEYTLDKLGELDNIKYPKIIFAHIICPHPPFIFGQNGEKLQRNRPFNYSDGNHFTREGGTTEEYINGYRNQTSYISGRLLETIDRILNNSKQPPIIIIQGDHGPGSRISWETPSETDMFERFAILNVYFFPRQGDKLLYPSITPINSFRIILNRYFGTNLEILPDFNYFTINSRPYRFIDITDQLREIEKEKSPDNIVN